MLWDLQVYMHYPFEREVPSTLPKGELKLDRPFGKLHGHQMTCPALPPYMY